MKLLKMVLMLLVSAGVTVLSLGCNPESNPASVTETQIVTVERGDIAVDITAVGNLALSLTEELAFDLFYAEGTVEEVLVEEGESNHGA